MKIGFISVTSRGRYLTPKADDYLKYGYFDFGEGVTVGELPKQSDDAPAEPVLAEPLPAEPVGDEALEDPVKEV